MAQQSCTTVKDCPCFISKDSMKALRLALSYAIVEKDDAAKENRPINKKYSDKLDSLFNQLSRAGEMDVIPKGVSVILTRVPGEGWLSSDDFSVRVPGSRETYWVLNKSFFNCE